MSDESYIAYIDGGSSGNPGESAIGGVIIFPDGKKEVYSQKIGYATNNYAEYSSLINALGKLILAGAKHVVVKSDSTLLVSQVRGEFRVRNKDLKRLHSKAISMISSFEEFRIYHINREENREADRLVKKALTLH
ncbi:MAG: ribonuclease HI family protein [Actinobacteria bacterium]|nr:ribonuclease HI family protein [Actinomycetota bacterium]